MVAAHRQVYSATELFVSAQAGEARESDSTYCTGFHYAKENEKILQAPRPVWRAACREEKKKSRNHVEHVSSPVVSYTVATLKAKTAIRARRTLARFFLQSTGLTNGARSPARGRMDRRKFKTEDEDRMGVEYEDGDTEQEQEESSSLTCRGPGLQDARRAAAKQVNKHKILRLTPCE